MDYQSTYMEESTKTQQKDKKKKRISLMKEKLISKTRLALIKYSLLKKLQERTEKNDQIEENGTWIN